MTDQFDLVVHPLEGSVGEILSLVQVKAQGR
jgi:hypothetical protein